MCGVLAGSGLIGQHTEIREASRRIGRNWPIELRSHFQMHIGAKPSFEYFGSSNGSPELQDLYQKIREKLDKRSWGNGEDYL